MTNRTEIQAASEQLNRLAGRWGASGFHVEVVKAAQAYAKMVNHFVLQDSSTPGPAIVAQLNEQRDRLDAAITRAEDSGYASSLVGACRRLTAVVDTEIRPWMAS